MRFPGIIYVSRLPVGDPWTARGASDFGVGPIAGVLKLLNVAALFMLPAAALGLVLVTVRRVTAATAWTALTPALFFVLFSLALFIEHRKATQAYGYFIALAGVAVGACMTRRNTHE